MPDHLLHRTGVFKERLSQSALYYETMQVADDEAAGSSPLDGRARDEVPHRPQARDRSHRRQILLQCKMYIAALRIADDFGCDLIGIQYQQGLEGLAARQRPGRRHAQQHRPSAGAQPRRQARVLFEGQPLRALQRGGRMRRAGRPAHVPRAARHGQQPVETTLHDIRWGDWDRSGTVKDYVWVLLISGVGAAGAFCGRLGRCRGFPSTGHVFSQRRQHAPRHLEAGRDRVVARLRRTRRAAHGSAAADTWSICRARKPSAAGKPQRPNGPSCTRCCTASRETP